MPLDPGVRDVLLTGASASGGAIAIKIAEWFLGRGDKRQSREDAIAEANDKLAAELRAEMRLDNQTLRDRIRLIETENARLVGQVTELNKINQDLRAENMQLQRQAGAESYRVTEQAKVIADQAEQINTMRVQLAEAVDRVGILEAFLQKAGVPLPEPKRRHIDTGPLSGPVGA